MLARRGLVMMMMMMVVVTMVRGKRSAAADQYGCLAAHNLFVP